MIFMDSPKDDEFISRNANLIAEELEKEEKYESLKANGIPCDGCEELFNYEELTMGDDDGFLVHLCKDC